MNKESITKHLMDAQFLINFSIVSLASLFGGYAEFLAHVRHGNGYQLGMVLSCVSIAALTMAALTKSRIAWALYAIQLAVGVTQFVMPFELNSIPNACLSLTSAVAAYAAANMLNFSLESQQQDKETGREHDLKVLEMEQKHAEKMARIRAKNTPASEPNEETRNSDSLFQLRSRGKSLREIADETGLSYSTVRRRLKQLETPDETPTYLNGNGKGH